MSLIEVVFASAILLFIAIGIMPLFIRSSFNNISGGDATQASQHAKSQVENLLTEAIDDRRFNFMDALPEHTFQASTVGTGGDEMSIGEVFWDDAAKATDPTHAKVGDGDWVADPSTAQNLVFWQRGSSIRQYTYADISDGVIDTTNPDQLATLGHGHLFDRPLTRSAEESLGHFREQDVELESRRAGGQDFGVGGLRTRILRAF